MRLRNLVASAILAFTLAFSSMAVAQAASSNANGVVLSWTYNSNHTGLNYDITNTHDYSVCITEDLDNQDVNVTGEVTPQFTLSANDSRFVGSINQYDSTQAWYAHVSMSWRSGPCN